MANFWTSSSDAPNEASPISCENWANLGSASRGTCPKSSWHVSLEEWEWEESHYRNKCYSNSIINLTYTILVRPLLKMSYHKTYFLHYGSSLCTVLHKDMSLFLLNGLAPLFPWFPHHLQTNWKVQSLLSFRLSSMKSKLLVLQYSLQQFYPHKSSSKPNTNSSSSPFPFPHPGTAPQPNVLQLTCRNLAQ